MRTDQVTTPFPETLDGSMPIQVAVVEGVPEMLQTIHTRSVACRSATRHNRQCCCNDIGPPFSLPQNRQGTLSVNRSRRGFIKAIAASGLSTTLFGCSWMQPSIRERESLDLCLRGGMMIDGTGAPATHTPLLQVSLAVHAWPSSHAALIAT